MKTFLQEPTKKNKLIINFNDKNINNNSNN